MSDPREPRSPDGKDWEKEFNVFLNSAEIKSPVASRSHIFQIVRRELNPSVMAVFAKLLAIHAVAGSLTLLVCPQFGVGPIGGGHRLMALLMQAGEWACAVFCGSFFFSGTVLFSLLLLRHEELLVIRRHQSWQFTLLAVLSFVILMGINGNQAGEITGVSFRFLTFWFLAAVGMSAFFFHGGHWLTRRSFD